MAKCNNQRCTWCNVTKELCMTTPYIVDCHCITYRRKTKDDIKGEDLIKQPFRPNCHKGGGGKYKTNKITGVFK